MTHSWQELTRLTRNQEFTISRINIEDGNIGIEGEFELPPLARLSYEDQVFIAIFIKAHGSIKEMESAFAVSYPTVKARLNRIGDQLKFIQTTPHLSKTKILDQLDRGEITAKEAAERLRQ